MACVDLKRLMWFFFTGGTAASAGSAPSYMDKINSIVNGDTKRKRDVGDDEGKEDY